MIAVDAWVDVACPWCYVGKRRLERAIELHGEGEEVAVRWRSFQLDPEAPRFGEPGAGEPVAEYLARKYGGGIERARSMQQRVTEMAATDGLSYDLEAARHANSRDALRLVHAAAARGVAGELIEGLFAAQHVEARRIDDPEVLIAIAADAGLPEAEAREVVAGNAHEADVDADIRASLELGVQGVPFFVIGGRYAIGGAQPAELLAQALARAAGERTSPTG